MKWITRARPKTDRIACPWLITKFTLSTPGASARCPPRHERGTIGYAEPRAGTVRQVARCG